MNFKLLALGSLFSALCLSASAQSTGTAVTYQGRLNNGANPANGSYDLTFSLYSAQSGGSQVGGTYTSTAVGVTNGLFTTIMDFGGAPWTGQSLWLQILVRTNGNGTFATLTPRQTLTPTPYAIYATSANTVLGTVPAAQISGTLPLPANVVTNNESGVTLNNMTLGGSLTVPATVNSGGNPLLIADNNLNFYFGPSAGSLTTSGYENTAVGPYALDNITSGWYNTAYGRGALGANTSGYYNTGLGFDALFFDSTGQYNTAAGYKALLNLTGGSGNLALGNQAGNNFTGNESNNIDIGNPGVAGENNTIRLGTPGIQTQTYIAGVINGNGAGLTNLSVSGGSGPANVVTNTETGVTLSGTFSGNGAGLTGITAQPPANVVTNTETGVTLSGTFSGNGAGLTNLSVSGGSGPANVVTNNEAGVTLNNLTVGGNLTLPATATVYAGGNTLLRADGHNNFFAGPEGVNFISTGSNNAANGMNALEVNVTGNYNTANGYQALQFNVNGSGNTASGANTLAANQGGSYNTANGVSALVQMGGGSNNVALGYQAGYNFTGNESGNIDIGNPGVAGENNIIRIGSGQTQTYLAGVISGNGAGLTNLTVAGSGGATNAWLLGGNNGTTLGANYLGTADNTPLEIRVFGGRAALFTPNSTTPDITLGPAQNSINSGTTASSILGGSGNTIAAASGYSILGGGFGNNIQTSSDHSVLVGGEVNFIYTSSDHSFIGGGFGNNIQTSAGKSFLGGGINNNIQTNSYRSVLVGGDNNNILTDSDHSFLGGGINNTIQNNSGLSVLVGGDGNSIYTSSDHSFLGGGVGNYIYTSAGKSFLGGGINNSLQNNAYRSVLVGGEGNTILSDHGFIGGGYQNHVNGEYGTVPGGANNNANGEYSFAAGQQAQAVHQGAFVWADSQNAVFVSTTNDQFLIRAKGGVGIGTSSPQAQLDVAGMARVQVLQITGGSDLAEPFAISTTEQKVSEGAVVVIDEANPGQLKLADRPYDTRVAGVVSGANGIHPGIQMQQQGVLEGGKNVALTGRVYVQADASNGAIYPGDLLTTSSTPGHAMKVTDHARAQGAILGKAMTGLAESQGLVLVLVTLQ